MNSVTAELSALTTAIEDLERRVTAIAAGYAGESRDDVLTPLYAAERQLRQAARALTTAGRVLAT